MFTDSVFQRIKTEFQTDNIIFVDVPSYSMNNISFVNFNNNKNSYDIMEINTYQSNSRDIHNILHEMGHFVEIEKERCNEFMFGLIYPNDVVISDELRIPGVFSKPYHIERECRVWAIQSILCEYLDIPHNIWDITSSFEYLDMWPARYQDDNYILTNNELNDYIHMMVCLYRKQYNIPWFKEQWFDRNEYVNQHGFIL